MPDTERACPGCGVSTGYDRCLPCTRRAAVDADAATEPTICLGGRCADRIMSRLGDRKRKKPMAVSWNPAVDSDNLRWREQAACRYTDANLFFPTGSTGAAIDQIEAAKTVCGSCPVADACLQFALETNQEAGIWGGTDEDERRRLRKVWRKNRRPARQSVTV